MIAGDGISATYASGANAITPVGVYSAGANAIAPTLIDPALSLAIIRDAKSGTITITQATTSLTWATPAAITYGTALSSTQLDATLGGVAGHFRLLAFRWHGFIGWHPYVECHLYPNGWYRLQYGNCLSHFDGQPCGPHGNAGAILEGLRHCEPSV